MEHGDDFVFVGRGMHLKALAGYMATKLEGTVVVCPDLRSHQISVH